MNYLVATLLTVLNAVWLFLVVLGLPGTWLMVASTLLVAWWRHGEGTAGSGSMFGTPLLVAIGVLALLGEVLEFLAGVIGSKSTGGSQRGALGALAGALVGGIAGTVLIPLPVVGSLLGACAGAALGALGLELHSGRALRASLWSGVGAGAGRFAGTVIKTAVGALIWVLVAVAAFWP
jgi:hypothetical protein